MKRNDLLPLLLFLCTPFIHAGNSFSFKSYQVEDGLSHNTVWCAMQDSYGFMWFGTSNGLNFYNGQTNKIYRNELNNKNSIENNYIQSLFELENQDILVGTNQGIYIYSRKNDHFTKFEKRTQYGVSISSEVRKVIKSSNGLLWIATMGQGVFIYNAHTDELTQYSLHTSFACDIIQQKHTGKIYVASLQQGVMCFDEEGNLLREYRIEEGMDDKDSYRIHCLLDIEGDLWIGVSGNQLVKLEEGGNIRKYTINPENVESIQCLMQYDTNNMLVGTDEGLYMFDFRQNKSIRIDNPENTEGMTDHSVNAIIRDMEGGVWILTNLGGANYFTKSNKRFYSFIPERDKGTSKVTGPFCEDSSGNIWIGTRRGLSYFNTKEKKLTLQSIGLLNERRHDIRALLAEEDEIWIGTNGNGLIRLNTLSNKSKQYTYSNETPNSICGDEVLSLYKTKNGDIYIGTSWGLCSYNKEEDNFTTVTAIGMMVSVVDIHEDMYGYLWIATSNSGVFRLNTINRHWKHFHHQADTPQSIISNSIITLFEDSRGIMWFGTNGRGLCSFDKETESFINFDPDSKLIPNKVIYAIEEDTTGDFWISTNAGLIRINPTNKSIPRKFTAKDGLQGNQFNFRSSLKSSQEWFFFGGINGFSMFQPKSFTDNEFIPPVYITHIEFPYAQEAGEKELFNIDVPVYMAKQITLPYINNSFSISFASLSYEAPDNNCYTYLLNGIDRDWIADKTGNTVSYTDLPPGKYVFEVKGSNNDNVWNQQPSSLTIIILPPWWRSNIAYFIYFIMLAGLVYYLAWRWNWYVKQKYNRRMKEFQVAKEKEIYQSKINFFINLVHEIRTPLSLIKLPLEKLQDRKQGANEEKYLSVIDRNVNYLLNTTNQLLDFQKMESGATVYKMSICNLNRCLENIYLQFTELTRLKGIQLKVEFPPKEIILLTDEDKLNKILVNLISNAIKYARTKIEVKLEYNKEQLYISVADDGPGIVPKEREQIFKAFYQINDHVSGGTGIGLAFSQSLAEGLEGKISVYDSALGGSEFRLSLPFKKVDSNMDSATVSSEMVLQPDSSEKEDNFSFSPHKFTIMLVEDNTDLLKIMKDSLAEWFTILKATNGREALRILASESPDIIVSDIMMPDMDGLELCRLLKTDINYSHIPVILLTAKTTLESKTEGLESGADAYVEKPFSMRQLRAQLENLLKLRISYHQTMLSLSQTPVDIPSAFSNRDRELMEKIASAVNEQLADENFSIDSLAETLHMSRSNFYRKMKALTGIAPNDYLKEVRLNKAAKLLQEGERVSDIYHKVGFNTSSYFSKCFKTKFGTPPNKWIKEQSSENT